MVGAPGSDRFPTARKRFSLGRGTRVDRALYTSRDAFAATLAAGAVTATTATPGPGTRVVVDTESKLFTAEPTYITELPIGDSKTANFNWPQYLTYASGSDIAIRETPQRIATGGWTVANLKDAIDAALAAAVGTPAHILINIGINETGSLPAEVTWKANLQYILDALHVKYPAALCYLAKVWRANLTYAANVATVNGWLTDTIAANSGFCRAGVDDEAVLTGHNDGDAHPDATGVLLYASAWRTVILGA